MTKQPDLFQVDGPRPYWKISVCGTWRYLFGWRWDPMRAVALFMLLNPSMGDPKQLDATMKKCAGFARRWHLGGFEIINPFAFRTSDPGLLAQVDFDRAVGPENDAEIWAALARRPARVVAGWGAFAHPILGRRLNQLLPAMASHGVHMQALRLTNAGAPWHPLYVPYSAQPRVFVPAS